MSISLKKLHTQQQQLFSYTWVWSDTTAHFHPQSLEGYQEKGGVLSNFKYSHTHTNTHLEKLVVL